MRDKEHIITFKADDRLVEAMEGISNRSEFIRAAIEAALDGACPLCRGTGVLTAHQREHWAEFSRNHGVETCHDCHQSLIVCRA